MHKSQLLLALLLVLGLVFSSVEAARGQRNCLKQCKADAIYCREYAQQHKTDEPCLTLYYVCNAGCAFIPRSLGAESNASSSETTTSTTTSEPTVSA